MPGLFIYDKYVTGKNFFGRKEDCQNLANLLTQGGHVAIWAPPKSGKMSLVQQTLFNLRVSGRQFMVGQFTLLDIRSITDFLLRFGSTVIRMVASTPVEYAEMVGKYLPGTHFVFDPQRYSDCDEVLSLTWDVDDADIDAILHLPQKLARDRGQMLYLIMNEFENVDLTEDGDKICKAMEKAIDDMAGESGPRCTFLLVGGRVNAMKAIFREKHHFARKVNIFQMHDVDEREITDKIVKSFLSGGKVVDKDLLKGVCALFRCNVWYISHFASILDYLSRGYIVETTMLEALDMLISIHEPRFIATMDSLTTFQVSLLKAILDGHEKFSAAEVIKDYALNSSANVKRLKDALMKKEIIAFDDDDKPYLLDPLFEYWVKKYYFGMKV
jgi:hypothetical protein